MPDRSVVQNDTSGSDKLVGPAAQSLKLSTGVSKIGGFVKPTVVTHENLVGGADEGAWMAFCHLARLCFSKRKRTATGRRSRLKMRLIASSSTRAGCTST